MNNVATHVVTGKARLSYAHLFQPYSGVNGGEPKYNVTVLVPKTDLDTKQRIDRAIEAAKQYGKVKKWNGVIPPIVAIPIYDGDGTRPNGDPFGDECKGHWVFTASSKLMPKVVDLGRNPIIDESEVYSGMYARVAVDFFAYNSNGKRGIGCGLCNVQKLADGEPLGGRSSVEDDFKDSDIYAQQYQTSPAGYTIDPVTGLPM